MLWNSLSHELRLLLEGGEKEDFFSGGRGGEDRVVFRWNGGGQ